MNENSLKTQIIILPNMEYYYLYDCSKTWPQKIVFTQVTWPAPIDYTGVDTYKDFQFFFDLIRLIEKITESSARYFFYDREIYFFYKTEIKTEKEVIVDLCEYEIKMLKMKEEDRCFPDKIIFEDKNKQETLMMFFLSYGGPDCHYDSLSYTLHFKNPSWKAILMEEGLKMNPDRYEISIDENDYPLFFEKLKRKFFSILKSIMRN